MIFHIRCERVNNKQEEGASRAETAGRAEVLLHHFMHFRQMHGKLLAQCFLNFGKFQLLGIQLPGFLAMAMLAEEPLGIEVPASGNGRNRASGLWINMLASLFFHCTLLER